MRILLSLLFCLGLSTAYASNSYESCEAQERIADLSADLLIVIADNHIGRCTLSADDENDEYFILMYNRSGDYSSRIYPANSGEYANRSDVVSKLRELLRGCACATNI